MHTINCRGKLVSLEVPLVFGIINASPDSFYPTGAEDNIDGMLSLAEKMISEGADVLDIGSVSTKPGSKEISLYEEEDRLLPVVAAIHRTFPEIILSVDTMRASIAKSAATAGASMINDVSGGGHDGDMISTVAELQLPFICMHMKGTPQTMNAHAFYEDVVKEVLDFFIQKVDECRRAGIHDIIVDPGFGFAKNARQNFMLLKNLSLFRILEKPILAGLSRKSTIYKTLGTTPADALNGSTVLHTIALLNGADILRVHDVKAAKEAITLVQAYTNSSDS